MLSFIHHILASFIKISFLLSYCSLDKLTFQFPSLKRTWNNNEGTLKDTSWAFNLYSLDESHSFSEPVPSNSNSLFNFERLENTLCRLRSIMSNINVNDSNNNESDVFLIKELLITRIIKRSRGKSMLEDPGMKLHSWKLNMVYLGLGKNVCL